MQQFDLSLWLQDKSRKVVTRDGRNVRIVCWDNTPTMPIIAVGSGGNPWSTDKDGYYKHNHEESVFDLFFADDKNTELTEFEKALVDLVSNWCDSHIETPEEYINKHSQSLIDLATTRV